MWHDAWADTLNFVVKSILPYLANFYFDFEETKSKGHKKNNNNNNKKLILFQAPDNYPCAVMANLLSNTASSFTPCMISNY